jgi:hypothetical protein
MMIHRSHECRWWVSLLIGYLPSMQFASTGHFMEWQEGAWQKQLAHASNCAVEVVRFNA